ncbi:Salicylate hydroxylase [Psilocybe cubensis]|uniref:FAD-binding domain-containing protein n=2 Tax=Psilocybe cubensis TaxID=181762 RepID=A0A8H7XLU8_PSICU|nr:Salicylate hydroxylase [Psilocybe cubensis]KAH9475471.1 Salicylate hydroxylase [Psilocybe cubensis]
MRVWIDNLLSVNSDSFKMPLRIGIIGGGIGGLTLAVALSRLNLQDHIQVNIYESAPELTQIGAGITFWPRAWKILEKLGVDSVLAGQLSPGQHIPDGTPRLGFHFRKADQPNGTPIRDLVFAGAALSFHRAVVQEVLLKNLSPSIQCNLSKRLRCYSVLSNEIQLSFEDGTTAYCDLLVGADGLKSVVRKQFVRENEPFSQTTSDPVWSGSFAYRSMIPSHLIAAELPEHRALNIPTIYCGKNQHIVAYPILQGSVINIAAYVCDMEKEGTQYDGPSFQDAKNEEVVPFFDSWEEEVRCLVKHMSKPSRWAIHAIQPLRSYTYGNVLLLGDAAHAMTPHQGNGAGQAIEDSYILAHLISKAVQTQVPLSRLTNIYDAIRRPFANFVHSASRTHGLLYEFNAPEFLEVQKGEEVGLEKLEKLGEMIVGDWEYAWLTTAEDDLERGLAML